jgi:hypothetical protein
MNPTQIGTQPTGESAPAADGIERSAQTKISGRGGAAPASQPRFLLCEHCHAPVERDQRYCVRCGTRQSHAANPATSYFAAAARSRRTGSPQPRRGGTLRGPWAALLLVLLPLGVAAGVLVGKGGASSNNDQLISALLKQPLTVASTGAAASPSAQASETTSANLASDFTLTRGYAVKLSALPVTGTSQAAVSKAEQEARGKGATEVGLINPKDFKTKPDQGSSNYVIYSGQFKARAQAQRALAKLKPRFPGAEVIEVSQASAAAAPVVAHTEFGTVHQIAGSRPTASQIREDKKVVQKINHTVGKSYVEAQKGLPDVIAVTGSGSNESSSSSATAEKVGEG